MTFSNLARALMLLPLTAALTQCDKIHALLKPKPEKPGPYAFDVMLEMSPQGEAALKHSQGLFVKASYYGYAKPAYRGDADSLNRLYLGDESWTYSANARKVHLKGEPIDRSVLPHTTDGQAYVVLSVNGLVGGPDNEDTLGCHSYIGTIQFAREHPQVLRCEFESEHYWDSASAETSSQ